MGSGGSLRADKDAAFGAPGQIFSTDGRFLPAERPAASTNAPSAFPCGRPRGCGSGRGLGRVRTRDGTGANAKNNRRVRPNPQLFVNFASASVQTIPKTINQTFTTMQIVEIHAREILDSRGNPTVEVEVRTVSGAFGRAARNGSAAE